MPKLEPLKKIVKIWRINGKVKKANLLAKYIRAYELSQTTYSQVFKIYNELKYD